MEKETIVRPSLLAADFLHLDRDLKKMKSLGITHCHFDVMDGTFVPALSFGDSLFTPLHKKYGKQITFDVHLMTIDPLTKARTFASLGAREICFHYEAMNGMWNKVQSLREEFPSVLWGLAISPKTDVSLILGLYQYFDYFLVMTVEPGKGGQSYISGMEEKVFRLSQMRQMNALSFKIGVDGGINLETGKLCYQNGADFLVCGSSYFKSEDKEAFLAKMHESLLLKKEETK